MISCNIFITSCPHLMLCCQLSSNCYASLINTEICPSSAQVHPLNGSALLISGHQFLLLISKACIRSRSTAQSILIRRYLPYFRYWLSVCYDKKICFVPVLRKIYINRFERACRNNNTGARVLEDNCRVQHQLGKCVFSNCMHFALKIFS